MSNKYLSGKCSDSGDINEYNNIHLYRLEPNQKYDDEEDERTPINTLPETKVGDIITASKKYHIPDEDVYEYYTSVVITYDIPRKEKTKEVVITWFSNELNLVVKKILDSKHRTFLCAVADDYFNPVNRFSLVELNRRTRKITRVLVLPVTQYSLYSCAIIRGNLIHMEVKCNFQTNIKEPHISKLQTYYLKDVCSEEDSLNQDYIDFPDKVKQSTIRVYFSGLKVEIHLICLGIRCLIGRKKINFETYAKEVAKQRPSAIVGCQDATFLMLSNTKAIVQIEILFDNEDEIRYRSEIELNNL